LLDGLVICDTAILADKPDYFNQLFVKWKFPFIGLSGFSDT